MDTPQSLADDRDADGLKSYACLTCRQRKVKCDRHVPCNNCTKANRECSFVPPARGKRKRTKPAREGLHAKLRRYEEQLKSLGAQIELEDDDRDEESDAETTVTSAFSPTRQVIDRSDHTARTRKSLDEISLHQRGSIGIAPVDVTYVPATQITTELVPQAPKLIAIKGTSRYFDSALWAQLGQQHPEIDGHDDSSSDEFAEAESAIFLDPVGSKNIDLTAFWPSFVLLSRIKDVFMDRGDPLMKILHMPTFWAALTNAMQHPRDTPKATEAILFAFCLVTVSTLNDEECLTLLGVEKAVLTPRFRLATRHALVGAKFLKTSDPTILQAYLMFMMGLRSTGCCEPLFPMSGVAIRLAQKIGLHRDGTTLGLSPFETEMRRRMWWQLAQTDFKMADMQGVNASLDLTAGDTKYPLNIDDEDLFPDMTELPPERKGIINVTICRLRCEIVDALRQFAPSSSPHLRFEAICTPDLTLEQKDDIIDTIEDNLEMKYVRYCDPANPLHHLVLCMVRAPICWMRFFAHNPRRFANNATEVSQRSRDIAFENARKMLGYASLLHGGAHGLGKYMWQHGSSFLWRSMLYVLIEVRHRKTGSEVDRSWQIISDVLSQFPQILEVQTTAVYKALGVWVLETWDECLAATRAQGRELVTPEYIVNLRRCCKLRAERKQWKDAAAHSATTNPVSSTYGNTQCQSLDVDFHIESFNFDFPNLLSMEADPKAWSPWEEFLTAESGFV
ncbi:hypothetical protein BDV96DRAFT_15587 [Lophiotrema nucula]|uniref:Zn(2)-C6 fungal-type domain-containing protein n=1 Tax=Lophiotrema nucula TaxID=690887 RepID=A0A6A5ZVZ2_9PLEO|nr:hypothetical protein BDV96DRAFT_15587 [Lophiotrema nucula]